MNLRCLMCVGVTSAAVVAACGGSMESASTTTTTSAPVMKRTTVLAARCARELDCGNLGYERTWPSYDACARDVAAVMRGALGGSRCTNGVDPLALEDCLAATRKQACAQPLSANGRIVAGCDARSLCL
jgi:hypothetical protein